MRITTIAAGTAILAAAGEASAGNALGLSLGATLGNTLGTLVGQTLGNVPLAGSGVLLVGAVVLGLGVTIARRKRR